MVVVVVGLTSILSVWISCLGALSFQLAIFLWMVSDQKLLKHYPQAYHTYLLV